jgi:type III secretory pathway component EscV
LLEKLLLNPAFVGVIGVVLGSVFSLLGTILSQIILSRKEQKQWANQQIAEQTSWVRNEQKKEKEYLREIYQNSLRSLSVFIALENQKEESKEQQKLELINEIHKWVTMLLIRHSGQKIDDVLNRFTSDPDEYSANDLRKEIIELSNREESFFINQLNDISEIINKSEIIIDPDIRLIKMSVDDNFRKQQLVDGVEIEPRFEFMFKLSKMSNSQREKLVEIFFQNHKTIPGQLTLYLPVHNNGAKQINMQGKQWQAKLNPNTTKPEFILGCWEKDFEKNNNDAVQSFKNIQ